jgi:sugar diacid utilization regulator
MGRRHTREKYVTGYVVKEEKKVEDPTTKAVVKVRHEISRVFHSLDAARTYMDLAKRQNPDGDFYIHEKKKYAEAA